MNFFGKVLLGRPVPDRPSRISIEKSEIISAPIFRLNVKCVHKLLDCLSLKELHVMSQTCRRFNVICGSYFLQNYTPSAVCVDNGIVAYRHQSLGVTYAYELNSFCQYIEKVIIPVGSPAQLRYVEANCTKALTTIRFEGVTFTEIKIKYIKRILSSVENIEIVDSTMNMYFYDAFLKYCRQLKSLSIRNFEYKIFMNKGNDWMFRTILTLEHLELTKIKNIKRSELEVLFDLNPNIRSFEIDVELFWENKMVFLENEFKWNDLTIYFQEVKDPKDQLTIYSFLNTFHQRGHFKRLHFRFEELLSQLFIDQIASIHALDTLHLKEEAGSSLPVLTCLTELYTYCGNLNMEQTVSNLANIKKLVFWEANIEDILTVVRNSIRIREIKVRTLNEKGRYSPNFNAKHFFHQNSINLDALNQERIKMLGASKITIYVHEDVYVATKWSNITTVFCLIELKRIMLHEWNYCFRS